MRLRERRSRRWPNLFVVGTGKAGTTSLAHYLGQHPDIFMSPLKEPHFFAPVEPRFFEAIKDERRYLKLFDAARGERYLGEGSVSYLRSREATEAIARVSPEARIVISLRNPIERAHSEHWQEVRHGSRNGSFLERVVLAVDGVGSGDDRDRHPMIRRGTYTSDVERYIGIFGAHRVDVLFFEEFFADVEAGLRALYESLGIDPDVASGVEAEQRNPYALPRGRASARLLASKRARQVARSVVPLRLREPIENLFLGRPPLPELEPRTRMLLRPVFLEDVGRLEKVLGRPVPWPEFRRAQDERTRLPGRIGP